MKKLIKNYKNFRPFTDQEAWFLFRLAAWGEAAGWTLLISGIICREIIHNNLPVLITGQFHGILFLGYIAASILLAPSLNWTLKRTLAAGLCSVPPYGSLVFELWAAGRRRRESSRLLSYTIFYRSLLGLNNRELAVE
jgi:integral membrane protein